MTISLTSPAFETGFRIPKRHTGDAEDLSPPLVWKNLPPGTRQLALICDDPDAPSPEPWVHWVIYGLSPQLDGLPEALPRQPVLDEPISAIQGMNTWDEDNIGYRGPAPPPAHGKHHYHFRLYALDSDLALEPGATKDQLLTAMAGHILAQGELIGTYSR